MGVGYNIKNIWSVTPPKDKLKKRNEKPSKQKNKKATSNK